MASVDCTGLPIRSDGPDPLEFGGLVGSALGGPTDRYDRLGDRWELPVQTVAMPVEPDGRRWHAKLMRAKRLGILMPFPQPGFDVGTPNLPGQDIIVAAATASGRTVPITGAAPNTALKIRWVSIVHDGQRYLDLLAEPATLDAAGDGELVLQNLIRVPLAEGDVVELARPMIEGWIMGNLPYPRGANRMTQFNFTIVEKA